MSGRKKKPGRPPLSEKERLARRRATFKIAKKKRVVAKSVLNRSFEFPISLISRLDNFATLKAISRVEIVTKALDAFLKKRGH